MDYFLLYNALGSQFNMKQERNVKELILTCLLVKIFFFYLFFFAFFRAAPKAYGGSQPRGQIGATAAGLHHSHSNTRSKPHLQPTP